MKKINILRAVFYGASLSFISTQFANSAVIANSDAEKTDNVAATLKMSKSALRDYAKSRFLILDPANKATKLYFNLALKPDPTPNSLPAIGFNAEAIQGEWVGYGSRLDRMSGGLSGRLWPCIVILSPKSISTENMREMISPVDRGVPANIPGTNADYLKITLLHELEHCRHITQEYPPVMQEYKSDQRALGTYLAQGGDLDVVRSWIFFRASNALEQALFIETGLSSTDKYIMGPALYDQFLARKNSGTDLDGLKDLQGAYLDVAYVLEKAAEKYIVPLSDLRKAETLHYVIGRVLKDPQSDLDPVMRRILEINKEAYEFFSRPSSAPAAQPALNM